MKNAARIALIVTTLSCPSLASAGPIDPPAGPVSSTYKTLQQVEPRKPIGSVPFTINQPGSYYLTSNLTISDTGDGIHVNASNVTIDLNGFTMTGTAQSWGILAAAQSLSNISVCNGTLAGWHHGIDLASLTVSGGEISRVRTVGCGTGIAVGPKFRISGCVATASAETGFSGHAWCIVNDCIAEGAGSTGYGFYFSSQAVIAGCTASQQGTGFQIGYGSNVDRCVCVGSQLDGFVVQTSSSISACNTINAGQNGFHVYDDSVVSGCMARSSDGHGFLIEGGCSITGSAAVQNHGDGIHAVDNCLVSGNNCDRNGYSAGSVGAGIYAEGDGSTVDGNHVTGNDYGIRTASANSLIIRNTARGNSSSNYSFLLPTDAAQVITNPGAGFVATNPWANFAY